jgi:hypothetical protein
MMRRAFRYGQATIGWLLLFVAVSGAIGLVIQLLAIKIGLSCSSHPETFGLLSWDCPNGLIKNSLNIALGWPRVAIVIPSLFLSLVQHGINTRDIRAVLNGFPFLIASIPFVLTVWAGSRYWWKTQKAIGASAILLLFGELIVLAEMA